MDIIKLVCDKKKINGIDPEDIQEAIDASNGFVAKDLEWVLQSSSFRDGIILYNKYTYDVKTIDCILNYFDLGNKSCATAKGYFNLSSSDSCATCINKAIKDYLSGRIKKKK